MIHLFKKHINSISKIKEEDFQEIIPFIELVHSKKKEILQDHNQKASYHYFVLKGCLRMFFINDKGVEITTDFALENWWIADQKSLQLKIKSECAIQAVESSVVMKISAEMEEKLCAKYPTIQEYFLFIYKKAYGAAQYRNMLFKTYSKEEIFLQFSKNFPSFIQRVPQYLIASYLGITPEYLSEIRKKSIS